MKKTWKKALLFGVKVLPFAFLAGIGMGYYSMGTGLAEGATPALTPAVLTVIITLQTMAYAFVSGVIGYLLAEKVGLIKPFGFHKKPLFCGILWGALCGAIFFVLDYLLFAEILPEVAAYYAAYPFSLGYFAAEVFYGGVVEELLCRWLLMSLLVLIFWRIFARKYQKEAIPTGIFVAANVLVALLFALGHLPATVTLFGAITPLIFIRCLLLNGSFGLVFGWLYRKKGIQYAMVAHAMTHVVCDALLFLAMGC